MLIRAWTLICESFVLYPNFGNFIVIPCRNHDKQDFGKPYSHSSASSIVDDVASQNVEFSCFGSLSRPLSHCF